MIVKPALAVMLASGLVAPETPKLVFPKPAIVKAENLDFSKHMLLGMPLTMGMLPGKRPFFINGNTGTFAANSTSLSWSHTTTSATTCVVVGGYVGNNAATANITGVTFNGVSMTQVQKAAVSSQGQGGLWIIFNPPIGTYTIVLSANSGDRGISGQSANFGGCSAVNVSANGNTATTDPRTLTMTSTAVGMAVAARHVNIVGTATITLTASSPSGLTNTSTPNSFNSNSNRKYQSLWYSPTLVSAGSTSFTTDCNVTVAGSSVQYMILT